MQRTHQAPLPEYLERRVLPSHDSREVKRALARDLLEATGADVASVYTIVRRVEEQVLRVFGMTVVGNHEEFERALMGCEGMAVGPISTLSSLTSVEQFEVQYREDMPLPLVEMLWDPSAVHGALGVNLLDDDGGHVAWIGAYRLGDSPRFDRRVPPQISLRREPYRDLLIAAHRMSQTELGAATMVMNERGEVLLASTQAEAWLAIAGFREALMDDLGALQGARDESRYTHFRSASVTLTRVEGEIGRAYVVTVAPQSLMRMPEIMKLSRAQRVVAELAGLGMTVGEIAKELSRSPETVRFHLRTIYEQLGIASRAELVLALREVA